MRWVAGKHQPLPDDLLLTQEIRDGECLVQLHLDPERKADPFSNLPRVRVLHGLPGTAPARETVALAWKNADQLEAAISIAGRETVLNTVEIAGQQPVTLAAVCLPYSPVFAPDQPGRGAAALASIATTTGGRDRLEIPKIWNELPVKSRYVELTPWLLVAAAVLLLLEIFERRTGLGFKIVSHPRSGTRSRSLKRKINRSPAVPVPVMANVEAATPVARPSRLCRTRRWKSPSLAEASDGCVAQGPRTGRQRRTDK